MCEKKHTPKTLTNEKSGQSIQTRFSDAEACEKFVKLFGDKNHWVLFWVHKYVNERTPVDSDQPTPVKAIQFLVDQFMLAIGYGLKRPMVRVHFRDQRFKLYLSKPTTRNPKGGTLCVKSGKLVTTCSCGTGSPGTHEATPYCEGPVTYSEDPEGDEQYVGCLLRGQFLQARQFARTNNNYRPYHNRRYSSRDYQENNPTTPQTSYNTQPLRPLTETEQAFLTGLSEDPVGFLAKCSKDMSRCCYCSSPLEDARSKEVGYGPICAKRWGLPWGKEKHGELSPSFATEWNPEAHAMFTSLRDHPEEESLWAIVSDWLNEHRLPRITKPTTKVTYPRNDSSGE